MYIISCSSQFKQSYEAEVLYVTNKIYVTLRYDLRTYLKYNVCTLMAKTRSLQNLTWNTNDPDFTPCFHKTILGGINFNKISNA
jgi:hypothetical protein